MAMRLSDVIEKQEQTRPEPVRLSDVMGGQTKKPAKPVRLEELALEAQKFLEPTPEMKPSTFSSGEGGRFRGHGTTGR